MRRRIVLAAIGLACVTLAVAAAEASMHRRVLGVEAAPRGGPPAFAVRRPQDRVLVAAGDIACPPGGRPSALTCDQGLTAALARRLHPDAVAPLGDQQYPSGSLADYRASFARTWGRLGVPLHPTAGNHEYFTPGARGYFDYFGAAAGPRGKGYYSYDLGAWHLVVLNANCPPLSCARGSAQERWLRRDLATTRKRCVLAYWHQPRFSSGLHGDDERSAPFWDDLYRARAELVLNGHDHDYERFAPQDPGARSDPRRGLREFVVGTGGESLYPALLPKPNSRDRRAGAFGVLALILRPDGYLWRYVTRRGVVDRGTGRCR